MGVFLPGLVVLRVLAVKLALVQGRSPVYPPNRTGIVAHHFINAGAENVRYGAGQIDLHGVKLTSKGRQVAFAVLGPSEREMHIVKRAVDVDPEAHKQRRAEN